MSGLSLRCERNKPKVLRLLRVVVHTDDSANRFMTLSLKQLLELEIEVVIRKTRNINGWWTLFFLLRSITTVLLLVNGAHQNLLVARFNRTLLSHLTSGKNVRSTLHLLGSWLLHVRLHLLMLHGLWGLGRDVLTHIVIFAIGSAILYKNDKHAIVVI